MSDPTVRAGLVIAIVGLAFYALLSVIEQPIPQENYLRQVTGTLTKRIVTVSRWKSETTAYVEIDTVQGGTETGRIPHLCFLWEDCMIPGVIANLRPGQSMALWLTYPVPLHGDDSIYIWRMRAGETTLLPFEEVAAANKAQRIRYMVMCGGVSAVGLLISAYGFIARHGRAQKKHP